MNKVGSRVGAINKAKDGVVEFFGFGIYVGDEIPVEAKGFLADGLKKHNQVNPKIQLDSGKVVYGCECWWCSERQAKELLASSKKTITVDIDDVRADLN